jgi:glycerol-1-phosphate dehydrogenase [NAD(P)+]
MASLTQISLPSLVRVKPGALGRLGIYLRRFEHRRVLVMTSHGMLASILDEARRGLAAESIEIQDEVAVDDASFEATVERFSRLRTPQAIVGLGGGKALDVAKYTAFLAGVPYYAVPTSLSNDGFCSPQASLTIGSRRQSLPARLPTGVVLDTEVCTSAPRPLWLSGVGDLVAKLTAVFDWKLSFHRTGELVNDFAALLSDATVHQYLARPAFDLEGAQLLGTALMLNGIAMEVAGSSRPASGSEHLISHALDRVAARPRLHGLQVGVATYLVSLLQQNQSERIARVFDETGFWDEIAADPLDRDEWLEAVRMAPTIKPNYFTILSTLDDAVAEVRTLLDSDPRLRECFGRRIGERSVSAGR